MPDAFNGPLAGGQRKDGRGLEEFRPVFINTNVISQARGSAYVEFAATKVMAGVFGPRQSERKFGFSEQGRVQCEVRLTSFAAKRLEKQQQVALERSLASSVHQALAASVQLDKMPKAAVDVDVLVLESGGSDLAVAITAASVALADAGIELYDMVPACQVARVHGKLLLDPTNEEAAHQDGSVLLAQLPGSSEVTQLAMTGVWSASEAREALELCMGGCMQLRTAMREALLQAVEAPAAGS